MARRSVALLIETSNAYARGLLEGIVNYLREHLGWSVWLPEQERGAAPPTWLNLWRGDGIIARIETAELARAVLKLGVPVVDVSAARHVPGIPWVETDDAAVSRLAFEHLYERGFRTLGFCGDDRFNWSRWRREHFVRLAEEAGCQCFVFPGSLRNSPRFSWKRERARLMDWVSQLPKPAGVMACYDLQAQDVLEACREQEIAVPDDVAVIGVDNDEIRCNLADPPLSSVIPDTLRTGYAAADLLARMMAGEEVPADACLIPPRGIATRRSTDVLAIDDPDLIKAWRFIREQACHGIDVQHVLKEVPLSRRALETRFLKVVGRTPHAEIMRLRIERVQTLLQETDLSLEAIARTTGFRHVEYLSVAFKRQVGLTPREFRRQHSH
jgi:LacI family transcriptional regulator